MNDTTEKLAKRYEISSYLNRVMMDFVEGSTDGLSEMVDDNLKRLFNMDIPCESLQVVIDHLENPERHCWSIHVDNE